MRAAALALVLILVGTAAISFGAAAADLSRLPEPLVITSLSSGEAPTSLARFRGRSTILMFWRADCAPCLVELTRLAGFEAAAHPGQIELVGLQDADALRSGLAKLGLSPDRSWRAVDDPKTVLMALNGSPPRLPLAVALSSYGHRCGAHVGLLGTDQIKSWVRMCG